MKLFKHFGHNHVKFAIGFALWVRIAAERRITLELELHEIFVLVENVPKNNHVKFAIGFALWDRIAAERRITLELELYGFFVTAKNVPEQLIP